MPLHEIAAITDGVMHGHDVLVTGAVVTDSREAVTGSLYVARVGEHADGHRFVGSARAGGAVAALTGHVVDGLPCVVVPDVQEAFARLGRAVVDRVPELTVVGITGSSGKTSTKDLLAAVLSTRGETVAPVGSLNSEVGVPLTVCRLTPTTRYLVAEMGASGMGHIEYLTRIAPPRIGVVLNVGSAHLGLFGSRANIARAKAELVRALPKDGLAVLNADDPVVAAMAEQTAARVVTVGRSERADLRASDVALDAAGHPRFTMHTAQGATLVRLGLYGAHQVGNALAVAAVALELGMSLADVAAAISSARPVSRWRMAVHDRPDGVTVINDAYNANPDSMRAALKALAAMGQGRRTWAVLGAMLELGPESDSEHAALGQLAVQLKVDRLVVVGEAARSIDRGARAARATTPGAHDDGSTCVPDIDTAEALLSRELEPGDIVLVKSSRDAGLRWLGDRLVAPVGEPAEHVHQPDGVTAPLRAETGA